MPEEDIPSYLVAVGIPLSQNLFNFAETAVEKGVVKADVVEKWKSKVSDAFSRIPFELQNKGVVFGVSAKPLYSGHVSPFVTVLSSLIQPG